MPNNKLLLVNLFDLVQDQLFFGDRLTSGEFATLLNPGQFISSKLSESNVDDNYIQSDLVNDLMDTSFIYKPLTGTVDSLYKEILEFAALPKKSASHEDEIEIEEIRKWESEHETAYNTYMDRYYDAAEAYDQYRVTENPSQAHLDRLKKKKDLSMARWNSDGFRLQWMDRENRLVQILAGNPTNWWGDLRSAMESQKVTSTHFNKEYYRTLLSPPVADWSNVNTSWAKFSKVIKESSTQDHARATSWDGGFSAGWGLWSIGSSASGQTTYRHQESDTSEVQVEFEYLRVRIVRPWITTNTFNYKFWTWKKLHGFQYVSDGGNLLNQPPVRPLGLMPFLPTHLIVVRNVKLSSTYSHTDETLITSQLSAGASFGWGPFSVSGHYTESNSDHYTNGSYDSGTLTITHPQIIAFSGVLIPRSPDPSPDLPWGTDAVLPHSLLSERQSPEIADIRMQDEARRRANVWSRWRLAKLQETHSASERIIARDAEDIFEKQLAGLRKRVMPDSKEQDRKEASEECIAEDLAGQMPRQQTRERGTDGEHSEVQYRK